LQIAVKKDWYLQRDLFSFTADEYAVIEQRAMQLLDDAFSRRQEQAKARTEEYSDEGYDPVQYESLMHAR
jgi:hypothetical protein